MDRRMTVPLRGISGGPCATCGAMTIQRMNRKTSELFLGCTLYPRCVGTWKSPLA